MSKLPPKIMNEEIKKYQGRIYVLEERVDQYNCTLTPIIKKIDCIFSTKNYCHCTYDLHHVIKYSDYESNKEWYQQNNLEMCLILLRKIIHQHLEYPMCSLSDEDFFKTYRVHRHQLLFNRKNFNRVGSKFPLILREKTQNEFFYDGCFDCLDEVQNA